MLRQTKEVVATKLIFFFIISLEFFRLDGLGWMASIIKTFFHFEGLQLQRSRFEGWAEAEPF